jgi:hypothetical protein
MDFAADASGTVTNSTSEDRATSSALANCKDQGGRHCEIVLTYHNQCAAITQAAAGFFSSATAATKTEAESRVIAKCGDPQTCRVLYSQCAVPIRVQ